MTLLLIDLDQFNPICDPVTRSKCPKNSAINLILFIKKINFFLYFFFLFMLLDKLISSI